MPWRTAILRKAICVAFATLSLMVEPAIAGQKFCAPEGTLEIEPTSVHYEPKNPTDKTKVVLSTMKTKIGFDAIIAARGPSRPVQPGRSGPLFGELRVSPAEMEGLEFVRLTAAA